MVAVYTTRIFAPTMGVKRTRQKNSLNLWICCWVIHIKLWAFKMSCNTHGTVFVKEMNRIKSATHDILFSTLVSMAVMAVLSFTIWNCRKDRNRKQWCIGLWTKWKKKVDVGAVEVYMLKQVPFFFFGILNNIRRGARMKCLSNRSDVEQAIYFCRKRSFSIQETVNVDWLLPEWWAQHNVKRHVLWWQTARLRSGTDKYKVD